MKSVKQYLPAVIVGILVIVVGTVAANYAQRKLDEKRVNAALDASQPDA